jgi:hypothetical protein
MALPKASYNVAIPHVRLANSSRRVTFAAALWLRFVVLLVGLLIAVSIEALAGQAGLTKDRPNNVSILSSYL